MDCEQSSVVVMDRRNEANDLSSRLTLFCFFFPSFPLKFEISFTSCNFKLMSKASLRAGNKS